MLDGFEDYTAPLTEIEERFVDPVARHLKSAIGPERALSNQQLRRLVGFRDSGSGPRMRKIIRYIRISGEVKNVVAGSKGYYVVQDEEDFRRYVKSLEGRIRADQYLLSALTLQWQEDIQAELFR